MFLDGPLEVAGSSGIAACGEQLPPRGRLRRTCPENGDLPVLKRFSIFLMGLMGLVMGLLGLVMGLLGLLMGLLGLMIDTLGDLPQPPAPHPEPPEQPAALSAAT